mgnify:CR=1 FL=1
MDALQDLYKRQEGGWGCGRHFTQSETHLHQQSAEREKCPLTRSHGVGGSHQDRDNDGVR